MRTFKTRAEDSTFELNLAPMLDIIVSIVPMLLLSVVFCHITMVETPVPQAVQRAMASADKKDETQIVVAISNQTGFRIDVNAHGQNRIIQVGLKGKDLDVDKLHSEVLALKQQFPDTFRLELHPDESIALNQIVAVMDKVRNRGHEDPKLYFHDTDSGKQIETDLIFPDVVFGNIAGG